MVARFPRTCYREGLVFVAPSLPKNPPLGGFFRFWRLLYAGGSRGSSPRSLKSCAFAHLVSQNLYFIGFTRCGIQLLQHHVARCRGWGTGCEGRAHEPQHRHCATGLGAWPRAWRIEGYTIFNSVLLFHSGTNCPLIRVSLVALFLMHGQSKKAQRVSIDS